MELDGEAVAIEDVRPVGEWEQLAVVAGECGRLTRGRTVVIL